ncbi:MAG: hypothetical protein ACTSV6_08845 [Candidatus Heimdallarchaeota archaeon]
MPTWKGILEFGGLLLAIVLIGYAIFLVAILSVPTPKLPEVLPQPTYPTPTYPTPPNNQTTPPPIINETEGILEYQSIEWLADGVNITLYANITQITVTDINVYDELYSSQGIQCDLPVEISANSSITLKITFYWSGNITYRFVIHYEQKTQPLEFEATSPVKNLILSEAVWAPGQVNITLHNPTQYPVIIDEIVCDFAHYQVDKVCNPGESVTVTIEFEWLEGWTYDFTVYDAGGWVVAEFELIGGENTIVGGESYGR